MGGVVWEVMGGVVWEVMGGVWEVMGGVVWEVMGGVVWEVMGGVVWEVMGGVVWEVMGVCHPDLHDACLLYRLLPTISLLMKWDTWYFLGLIFVAMVLQSLCVGKRWSMRG